MHLRFTICICLLSCAWADTIHLKNGQTIRADSVRDTGDRVEYDIGDDKYAIPKSSVDHIESASSASGPAHVSGNVAAPRIDAAGLNEVAPDGKIMFRYSNSSANLHVAKTLEALRTFKTENAF